MLTSVKEEQNIISPSTPNFSVRKGKLRIYTLRNPAEVFWKLAPYGGYKEYAAVRFVYMERSSSFNENK